MIAAGSVHPLINTVTTSRRSLPKYIHVGKLVAYHNGRGAQEDIFAELKSQTQMDYIPIGRQAGRQI